MIVFFHAQLKEKLAFLNNVVSISQQPTFEGIRLIRSTYGKRKKKKSDLFFSKSLANIIRLTTGSLTTRESTNTELIKN